MVKSEAENVMEAGFGGQTMEVRVSSLWSDLLGISDFAGAVCKWG
jgi:hypothetical protein